MMNPRQVELFKVGNNSCIFNLHITKCYPLVCLASTFLIISKNCKIILVEKS